MTTAPPGPSGDPMTRLLAIMAKLRDPAAGCRWDREQTFQTIAPYTIEEAYEVADAIAKNDMAGLKDELGDLLFQVVFHARMAEEAGQFAFPDVAQGIVDKMVRRHPHVFGKAAIQSAGEQTVAWEAHKAAERLARRETEGGGVLDDVAAALPAATRAVKLQARAAQVGFDWPDVGSILAKIDEEINELRQAIDGSSSSDAAFEELGDVWFALTNLARRLAVDPESALRHANAKFERRFRRIEALLRDAGKSVRQSNLAEMDALWDQVKREERDSTSVQSSSTLVSGFGERPK
jgi:nucleoside triphosphate diphosphatase